MSAGMSHHPPTQPSTKSIGSTAVPAMIRACRVGTSAPPTNHSKTSTTSQMRTSGQTEEPLPASGIAKPATAKTQGRDRTLMRVRDLPPDGADLPMRPVPSGVRRPHGAGFTDRTKSAT